MPDKGAEHRDGASTRSEFVKAICSAAHNTEWFGWSLLTSCHNGWQKKRVGNRLACFPVVSSWAAQIVAITGIPPSGMSRSTAMLKSMCKPERTCFSRRRQIESQMRSWTIRLGRSRNRGIRKTIYDRVDGESMIILKMGKAGRDEPPPAVGRGENHILLGKDCYVRNGPNGPRCIRAGHLKSTLTEGEISAPFLPYRAEIVRRIEHAQAPPRAGLIHQVEGDWRPGLLGNDLGRTRTFRALLDLVGDALSFGQRLEAAALDGAMMDEYVFGAVGRGDKAETLFVTEPLNCACSHYGYLLGEIEDVLMQTTVEIFRKDLPRTAERGTTGTLQGNTALGGVCRVLESMARFSTASMVKP